MNIYLLNIPIDKFTANMETNLKIDAVEAKLDNLKKITSDTIDDCISELRSLKRCRSLQDMKRNLDQDINTRAIKKTRQNIIRVNKRFMTIGEERTAKKTKTLTSYMQDMKL